MDTTKRKTDLQSDLEDILGSLQFARRSGDLGRLAFLTYWDVRRWARAAHEGVLAEHATKAITDHPHPTRAEFLEIIDEVIAELEGIRGKLH